MTIAGKRKADPVLRLRRVFVWSSARAGAAATARARKLDRASDDLERLTRGLGSRHYPDRRQGAGAPGGHRQGNAGSAPCCAPRSGTDERGKPTLAWRFDPAALAAEPATDGWYALLTNLDPTQVDAAEVLARYKGQEVVERRYGAFKGPLAVAPLFVQSNRRIQALVTVICLALLIFCLVERQVRRAIAPAITLDGPVRRPAGQAHRAADLRGPGPPAAASPPAATTHRSSPSPHRCKPDCCNCWTWTPPSLPDQPHRRTRCAPTAPTLHSSSCAKDPASGASRNWTPVMKVNGVAAGNGGW